jgi:hypothetical protein
VDDIHPRLHLAAGLFIFRGHDEERDRRGVEHF